MWCLDLNMPILTENREYIDNIIKNAKGENNGSN
jgi:hypothetical protein